MKKLQNQPMIDDISLSIPSDVKANLFSKSQPHRTKLIVQISCSTKQIMSLTKSYKKSLHLIVYAGPAKGCTVPKTEFNLGPLFLLTPSPPLTSIQYRFVFVTRKLKVLYPTIKQAINILYFVAINNLLRHTCICEKTELKHEEKIKLVASDCKR